MCEDLSDGLFTVKCDCGVEFPAENGKCSCGNKGGELRLDVDQFLNRVYSLQKRKKDEGEGLDLVFDVFWQLYDRFDIMNDILAKLDVTQIDTTLMVGFITQTFKYDKQVTNHAGLCDRIEARLRELGESEERIARLVTGRRTAGNYWDNMKAFGAPGWLSGPKP
jgi:hypothetical protein